MAMIKKVRIARFCAYTIAVFSLFSLSFFLAPDSVYALSEGETVSVTSSYSFEKSTRPYYLAEVAVHVNGGGCEYNYRGVGTGDSGSVSATCSRKAESPGTTYSFTKWVNTGSGWVSSPGGTYTVSAPACTSFTYSGWGACQPSDTQSRTIISKTPSGCVGTPVTSQNCTYVPSVNCVGSWGTCSGGSQTYTITTNASGDGTACSYANGATQSCGTAGGWSSWSPTCHTSCGYSGEWQYRSCNNPAPSGGGASCAGGTTNWCSATSACPPSLSPSATISNSSPLPNIDNPPGAYTLTGSVNNTGGPYSGDNCWKLEYPNYSNSCWQPAGSGTTVTPYTGSTGPYDNITYNFYLCAYGGSGPCSSAKSLKIIKRTPSISWANPANITYGTALGTAQLNATANVGGTLTYNPVAGTVLGASAGPSDTKTLFVSFTPSDSTNYTTASKNVNLYIYKADQSISFPAIGSKTVGDADFTPTASAPGGAVTFTASPSGVCTIVSVSGKVHLVAAGDCTVTALQAGNANYNAATPVSRTFTVTPGVFTLTATAPTNGTISATGISCGSDCIETYTAGTVVSVTANPSAGYSFGSWGGSCAGQGNPCSLTMNSNKSVSANFTVQPFDYSLGASGNLSLFQNASIDTEITSSLTSGMTEPVTLSVSGLPAGMTATFDNNRRNPSAKYVLTITTGITTPAGTHTLVVTGSPLGRTVPFQVEVKALPVADLFVNGQLQGKGGRIRVPYGSSAKLTWTTQNAVSCAGSGEGFVFTGGASNNPSGVSVGPLTSIRTLTLSCSR